MTFFYLFPLGVKAWSNVEADGWVCVDGSENNPERMATMIISQRNEWKHGWESAPVLLSFQEPSRDTDFFVGLATESEQLK